MINIIGNVIGSIRPSSSGGGGGGGDTTADGKQVFWILGDSISRGTSSAKGPTPTSGTVYEWNDVTTVEVGANDLINANIGSEWPQFGVDYNAFTGNKPVFVSTGSTGSEFSPNGDTNNWSTSGALYAPAKARVDACLTNLGLARPKAILMILGINDANPGATSTLSAVQTDITSLFTRLTTDYPGVPVVIAQIGVVSTLVGQRTLAIRDYLKSAVSSFTNVHFGAYLGPLWAAGLYNADNIHLDQPGNNELGKMFCRWFKNTSYTNKWTRAIICSHFDDLSTVRKDVINTAIGIIGADYFYLDALYNFKTTAANNRFVDWTLSTFGTSSGEAFSANDCITSNGTSTYFRSNVNSSLALKGNVNDTFEVAKIKTNRSPIGSLRIPFGLSSAAAQELVAQQPAGGLYYRAHDLTLSTYPTEVTLQNATSYGWYRTSSTVKGLLKNGASVATANVNTISLPNLGSFVGANNNNNVANAFIDADFEWYARGSYNNVNMANLNAAMEYVAANWNN